jgi:hypothetical protein
MRKSIVNRVAISLFKTIYPYNKQIEYIAYDQLKFNGIKQLYNHLTKQHPIVCFIHIGSGRGPICMCMAIQPNINLVLGVEPLKYLHDDAEDLKLDLKSENSDKVILLNKSILDVNLKKYPKKSFVWFGTFHLKDKNNIFKKLKIDLPSGALICSLYRFDINIGELLESVIISESLEVYIYRL